MKRSLCLSIALLGLFAATTTSASEKQIVNIYDCARKIVQQRTYKKEHILLAKQVLEQLLQNTKNENALEVLEERCEAEKDKLYKLAIPLEDKLEVLAEAIPKDESNKVNTILKAMVSPQVKTCRINGGEISIGVFQAFSVGLMSTRCEMDDGTILNGSSVLATEGIGIGVIHRDFEINDIKEPGIAPKNHKTTKATSGEIVFITGYRSAPEGQVLSIGIGAVAAKGIEHQFLVRQTIDEDSVLNILGR